MPKSVNKKQGQARDPRLMTCWWGLAIRFVVATIILVGSNLAVLPLMSLIHKTLGQGTAGVYATAASMAVHTILAIVLVGAWMRWVEFRSLHDIALFNTRAAVRGFFGGLIIVGVVMVMSWMGALVLGLGIDIDVAQEFAPAGEPITVASVGAVGCIVIAQAILLQGFPEELIFRGWLMDTTRHRPRFSLCWTTAAFTVIHLLSQGGQNGFGERIIYLINPLGMGVLAGVLVIRKGTFWWAVGTHSGMHMWYALLMLAYPVEEGPALWALMGVAHIVASLIVIRTNHTGQVGVPTISKNSV